MISGGSEGSTIQFGSVDFSSIIAQNTVAPAPTSLISASIRRAQDGDASVTVVEVPRKRTSVFERLSATGSSMPKRRITGQNVPLVPASAPALFPVEHFAPRRYDTEASSSGVKPFRRQRRKINAVLCAQQLLPPTPTHVRRRAQTPDSNEKVAPKEKRQLQEEPQQDRAELPSDPIMHVHASEETPDPTSEENAHTSEKIWSNLSGMSVREAGTVVGDMSAAEELYPWASPVSQAFENSEEEYPTIRGRPEEAESSTYEDEMIIKPSRSGLQESVVLSMLGHNEEIDKLPEEGRFESEIPVRITFVDQPEAWQYREMSLHFLRDMILKVNLEVPSTYDTFMTVANGVLEVLASVGLEEKVLRFWEGVCRQVEVLIWRNKTLRWTHFNATFSELEKRVKDYRIISDQARDNLDEIIEVSRRQQYVQANALTEYEGYTARLKKLWWEITSALTYRTKVLEAVQSSTRSITKVEQVRQRLQQDFDEKEKILIQAKEELTVAQAEQPSSLQLANQLERLKIQLSFL